jgi:hypothetical protein
MDLQVKRSDLQVRSVDLQVKWSDLQVRSFDLQGKSVDLKVKSADLKVRSVDLKVRSATWKGSGAKGGAAEWAPQVRRSPAPCSRRETVRRAVFGENRGRRWRFGLGRGAPLNRQ